MLIGLLLTFTTKYETIKVAVGFSQFTENFHREFFSIFRNISHTIIAHLLLRILLQSFITVDCFSFLCKSTCD